MLKSINRKLFFSVGLAIIITFGTFTYFFLSHQQRQHTQEVYREANIFSEIITRSNRFNMPIGNRECVHRMMENIGKQSGVEVVRMFNKKGKIMFSTQKNEINTNVDMKAEACNSCHESTPPRKFLPFSARTRIFRSKDHRVLAITTPINNEPACYNGSCHVHSKETEILGTLDVGISLARIDNELKRNQVIFILFTLVALLCFSLIITLFIQRLVTKPVKKLVKGTRKIAQGDLEVEIPVKTKDEIGQLAISFNHMVEDLKKAQQEIKSWNIRMEKKVEVRTEKLRRAREQLIQSEKMASMGVLASSVAHEINNPLQGILTYIKLMLKIISAKDVSAIDQKRLDNFKNYLELMGNEIGRCGDMVKNLLVFSKQTKMEVQEAKINNIIKNSLLLMENKIKLQDIEVVMNLQENIPVIYCDVKQIQQTLLAIIINAVEAMPKGGKISIDSHNIDNNEIEITIADTGPGIPRENLKHIFDPFFTTKDAAKSTGLGLFVAYGIIREHKGTIKVESEAGKGTVFHIRLPVRDVAASARDQ
ncbi:MAG: ATP-binding protein [Candidatus Aminicenantes bacterium]|jgi:two-component system NtrC family sensor kinase